METNIKIIEYAGLENGTNVQLDCLKKVQVHIGFDHQSSGMSCTAKIIASGRYEPIKMKKPEISRNCKRSPFVVFGKRCLSGNIRCAEQLSHIVELFTRHRKSNYCHESSFRNCHTSPDAFFNTLLSGPSP